MFICQNCTNATDEHSSFLQTNVTLPLYFAHIYKAQKQLNEEKGNIMLKKARGFILGFISSTLIFVLALTVFAAPVEKAITAVYNGIRLYIDGKEITPKDASGNTIEPFIYNGTTYLPVRAVGEAIGKSVEWDAANLSVYLGKRPDGTGASMWLTNLTPIASQCLLNNGKNAITDKQCRPVTSADTDNYGNEYDHGQIYSFSSYSTYWMFHEYATDMKYGTLSGTIALANATKNTNELIVVDIEGVVDGTYKVLYRSPVISLGKRPVDFSVDISGWSNIRVVVSIGDKNGNITDSKGNAYRAVDDVSIILGNLGLN